MIRPSPEDLEKLVKLWFAEARERSAQDNADVEAWKKEHRKWTRFDGDGGASGNWGEGSNDSGSCGAD